VEALQGRDGDKDDDSLLAVANFDLFKIPKSACELQDKCLGPLPVLLHRSQYYSGQAARPSTDVFLFFLYIEEGACR
jgi:hypothetical protein